MPRYLWSAAWAITVSVVFQVQVHAGGGPQNVAVIANPEDPDSLAIANYYIELRGIPPANVVYIPWRVDLRSMTGPQFRDKLLKPFLAALDDRGLTEQINFVAFSSGYPYLVDCGPLFRGQQFPPQARPTTSLTSAMFYYQDILDGNARMFSAAAHEYFSATVNGRTASKAFSTHLRDGAGGSRAKRHFLATALGVTHGHGNTGGEITACLRRAKVADGTKPRGTIYYMRNRDVRSRVRDGEYAAAVQELAAAGVRGVVLQGVAPPGKPDVAGLTTGAPHVDLKGSGSKLLPGALVDNLTSAGGQMLIRQEGKPQTRISQYIRLGAAGASGAVVEPYAIAQKFPTAALHVHYARGCSLAEAFYQSIAAPFHLLIIGDPLCQPWATPPTVRVAGVTEGTPISGTATLTAAATFPDERTASRFELYIDGVRKETLKEGEVSLDTKNLADGWHELRLVAIDNTEMEVQGAWVGMIEVRNGDARLELKNPEPIQASVDATFAVEVESTEPADAHIVHNGVRIGMAPGGSGRIEIDASSLGKGRTFLHAEQDGPTPSRSKPVAVEIR